MAQTKPGAKSPLMEAAVGFALGAVAGCILGITEDPVDQSLLVMTAAAPMKPVMEEVRTVGPLGLGTLIGATALTTAMTSVVAGVILAAVVASVFVVTRKCGASHIDTVILWTMAGFAGALGTTLSGATLGVAIEWIVRNYGMIGLLWALSILTVIKPPLHYVFKILWKQGEACCTLGTAAWVETERKKIETTETEQRQRVAVQIEKRILMLEKGGDTIGMEPRMAWMTERMQREEIERKKMEREEAEMEQRTLQDWINTVVVKYVDFLAFAGIPMTVVAIVTSGFGVFGYGDHQSVFIVLLALVAIIAYMLLKSSDFKFWMLVGCMGMLATFVIAMLTLHAGQVVVSAMKMRAAGQSQSKEDINTRINQQSSLEALNAAFFVAKLCELGLGATVGGPLVRRAAGEVKVIVGAALVALGLLAGVRVLSLVLGDGGTAGALLGMVGATGVCVGAAAAVAGRWSSWPGTLGTIVGLVLGALVMGKWHIVNIGLQLPVAYVFAMTNPF
ncbi:hypothetical protein D9C73_015673 [Collichthys lucidus]|uniref:Uncharacterized protein n=1 Tax=Collichthys lucidus TaxID=240159 RepID=A0A4U5V2A4_COLLU|nr:hypothetical protein D9C73_015673 [Collichthys lucidus]